jgi:hypothetical protein
LSATTSTDDYDFGAEATAFVAICRRRLPRSGLWPLEYKTDTIAEGA